MLKIGVLCSGHLGLQTLKPLLMDRSVEFVMSDRRSTDIIELCRSNSIATFVGNPRKGAGNQFVRLSPVDVIVCVNYLFIVDQDIIDHPKHLAFNLHGSLLPKYRGRTPHVWAIINGEKQVGVTAHKIELNCDAGDIIEQVNIPIDEDDTGGILLRKFESHYGPIIDRVLHQVDTGNIVTQPQDESLATWFGKRTSNDGEINWNWFRERIRNWVRAQADPYPGAFTWHSEQKIVIDRIRFSDCGFDAAVPNGTLLQNRPVPIIKTPNGAVALESVRGPALRLPPGIVLGSG